jgi:uncharacterized protein YggU (UPF0235/DUF167 family)
MIRPMLRVTVVAHPGARTERVELGDQSELHVWVRARPIDSQANAAIERAIAAALGLKARQVRMTAGATRRRKIVDIDLPDQAALDTRLVAHTMRVD